MEPKLEPDFEIDRVFWEVDKFEAWNVTQTPRPLAEANLPAKEVIIVVEREGDRWAFLLREVTYHHIVQGSRNDVPYMITFCGLCNAGVLVDPVINGILHHFREIGLYNGQQIYTDDETGSLWNHLTGKCLHGPLIGTSLPVSHMQMITVGEQKQIDSQIELYQSNRRRLMQGLMRFIIDHVMERWMPQRFNRTLGEVDPRLPRMTMGMAIRDGDDMRFFPHELYKGHVTSYDWGGRELIFHGDRAIPFASWASGDRPFQLLTRWYAYCLTYPHGRLISELSSISTAEDGHT